MAIAIGLMIVMWLAVVMSRNTLRAYWWADRLARADTAEQQLTYFQLLATHGDSAVGAMRSLLKSDDALLRGLAVGVLNHATNDEAGALLAKSIGDTDTAVRKAAILGLSMRSDATQHIARITEATETPDTETAMSAVASLGNIESERARDVLIASLDGGRPAHVRIQAVETLGFLGVDRAVPALVNCLGDTTVYEGLTENQRAAQFAIAQSQGLPPPEFSRRHTVSGEAARALFAITGRDTSFDPADAQSLEQAQRFWTSTME